MEQLSLLSSWFMIHSQLIWSIDQVIWIHLYFNAILPSLAIQHFKWIDPAAFDTKIYKRILSLWWTQLFWRSFDGEWRSPWWKHLGQMARWTILSLPMSTTVGLGWISRPNAVHQQLFSIYTKWSRRRRQLRIAGTKTVTRKSRDPTNRFSCL